MGRSEAGPHHAFHGFGGQVRGVAAVGELADERLQLRGQIAHRGGHGRSRGLWRERYRSGARRTGDSERDPRFTITPALRAEILDRLLELNPARCEEEQEAGLHAPGARKKAAPTRVPEPSAEPRPEECVQDGFF